MSVVVPHVQLRTALLFKVELVTNVPYIPSDLNLDWRSKTVSRKAESDTVSHSLCMVDSG
jgi:hypothetical protein